MPVRFGQRNDREAIPGSFGGMCMKKSVRKADVIIILCLILIFAVIIFMNTRLINNMMLNQIDQSNQNRVEIIRSEYETASMEVEKALFEIVTGAEKIHYSTGSRDDLKTYINGVHNRLIKETDGVILRVYTAGQDWQFIPGAVIPDGYMASEQAWYKEAVSVPGELCFSDPYYDSLTGVRCFTLAMSLDDSKTVIAMDMKLDAVEQYVKRMAGKENSPAISSPLLT